VWAGRFAAPPADAREWARQARFLQGRGFASETIRRLLKALATDLHEEIAE
jgi:regulatory protein